MAKRKYKRKPPPKRGRMTVRPWFSLTNDTANKMNDIANNWADRSMRGRELFLLELNRIYRDLVKEKAPEIDGYKYANDLKIGIVKGVTDGDVVVLYFDDVKRKFEQNDNKKSALMFSENAKSPKYVKVLEKYGPWPSELVPIRVEKEEATIVARSVRDDEYVTLKSRILSNRMKIENELRSAGIKNIKIEPSNNISGVEVHDDVGYTLLRKEFGFEGKQESHWRPALKALRDEIPVLMEKYKNYIINGRESVFYLPDESSLSKAKFQKMQWFQDRLK